MQNLKEQQIHQFPKYYSKHQTAKNTDSRRQDRLNCHHSCNMPLSHSKNIVYSDLFLSSFDQETIRIEQKNHCKYNDHTRCILKTYLQCILGNTFPLAQCVNDIEHHDGQNTCKDIGYIGLTVILKIGHSKFFIDEIIHPPHLLW